MKETIGKAFKSACLLLITLSMVSIAISLSSKNTNVYDVNKDGRVSSADYVLIRNYIMNNE